MLLSVLYLLRYSCIFLGSIILIDIPTEFAFFKTVNGVYYGCRGQDNGPNWKETTAL